MSKARWKARWGEEKKEEERKGMAVKDGDSGVGVEK
jgi:hypothetical protein